MLRTRPVNARGSVLLVGLMKSAGLIESVGIIRLRAVEVISIVGMVEQVECLERKLQIAAFTQLDVLCYTGIHVEVWIAAQAVVRSNNAIA